MVQVVRLAPPYLYIWGKNRGRRQKSCYFISFSRLFCVYLHRKDEKHDRSKIILQVKVTNRKVIVKLNLLIKWQN